MGDAPPVQALDLGPDGREQLVGELRVVDRVERPGVECVVGQNHGSVVDLGEPEERRRPHAEGRRPQRHQSLVLDRAPQRRERPLVAHVLEPHRAVEAEQQVGAALLGADHLHEGGAAVAERGEVRRRAAGVDVGGPQVTHVQPGDLQRRAHAGARRVPVLDTEGQQDGQPDGPPDRPRRQQVDRQAGPRHDPTERHRGQRPPRPPPPAAGHRRGDHRHGRGDARHVGGARVGRTGDPAVGPLGRLERRRADAVGRGLRAVHHQVGHHRGEHGQEQGAPASEHHQGHHGGERGRRARRPGSDRRGSDAARRAARRTAPGPGARDRSSPRSPRTSRAGRGRRAPTRRPTAARRSASARTGPHPR